MLPVFVAAAVLLNACRLVLVLRVLHSGCIMLTVDMRGLVMRVRVCGLLVEYACGRT